MRAGVWLGAIALVIAGCDGARSGEPEGDSGTVLPRTDGGGVPEGGPTCIDGDGDGYGVGCALGLDCDDSSGAVSPAASESCNGVDDDCDGDTDEDVGAPSCELTEGVCAGATRRCGGEAFLACDASDYGADYEVEESACDGLDNDCDGLTDEGCPCTDGATQACGSSTGECNAGTQMCSGGTFGACEGADGPMGEVCDGLDNDCDGTSDEPTDLVAPDCPLTQGVCAGRKRACGGAAGWIACEGVESYGGDYQAEETACDGLDNDCDGVTDEGCTCVDGTTQACGTDVGACVAGTQTCVSGGWGACAGEVSAALESCNGADDDCDGDTDEDVVRPACALTAGVCAGAVQRCGGAGGFVACTAADYGSHYQATETRCDGRDNDCDGEVDEGCDCVDGATQPCGTATGACELGSQTCTGGVWGACTGGVGPVPETCNGRDDDCNGVSDDNLTAPSCALSQGVCAGTVRTCGGAAGWLACAGAASYGSSYVAVEDGSNEAQCDGLDNDCDGTQDEDCVSGPLTRTPADESEPDLYLRNLVYITNAHGNDEVVFQNLDRGDPIRITTTPEPESRVRIAGDRMVFVRGIGENARAVLFDLTTMSETVLSTRQTNIVVIADYRVAWDEFDGSQWDVIVLDMRDGSRTVIGRPGSDEYLPGYRDGVLAYASTASGSERVEVVAYDEGVGAWGSPVAHPGPSGPGVTEIQVDFIGLVWSDGRAISGTPTAVSDWDVYGSALIVLSGSPAIFPGEFAIDTALGPQLMSDLDSGFAVWSDGRNGNWDVGLGLFPNDGSALVTSSPAIQAEPSISGAHLVWTDNRLGNFDIFHTTIAPVREADRNLLRFTEILADPAEGADTNGDGVASTSDDEFVEIRNAYSRPLDLSGVVLQDAAAVRHTFPPGTVLPTFGRIVVFAGGTPRGTFGGAIVQVANGSAAGGGLGLNNTGDTLTLTRPDGTVIETVTYGSEANHDESIVRTDSGWTRHSMTPGAIGRFSPGLTEDGFAL